MTTPWRLAATQMLQEVPAGLFSILVALQDRQRDQQGTYRVNRVDNLNGTTGDLARIGRAIMGRNDGPLHILLGSSNIQQKLAVDPCSGDGLGQVKQDDRISVDTPSFRLSKM